MRLFPQVGSHVARGVDRMVGGIEVVFVFKRKVERGALPGSLNTIVRDEIRVKKLRWKMYFPCRVGEGSVGESLRGKYAR